MVKQSSQPVLKKQRPRTCVGCGEESPKRTLLRVIKAPDGEVRYDPTGKAKRPWGLCLRPPLMRGGCEEEKIFLPGAEDRGSGRALRRAP